MAEQEKMPEERPASVFLNPNNPDTKHPALVEEKRFYFFSDNYQLPGEPKLEKAVETYLDQVDKAFQNEWPLHPNLIFERDTKKLTNHAYNLDFRENEIGRIRSILPPDVPVFSLIDALTDVVMLQNLKRYASIRLEAFQKLRLHANWFFLIAAIFGLLTGIATYHFSIPTGSSYQYDSGLFILGGIVFFCFLFATIAMFCYIYFVGWPFHISQGLKNTKEKYEEAVRDAAGLAATKLQKKGADIAQLMNDLKNRLDQLGDLDEKRVIEAPKLVRVLLWCPERMGLIENYYRAKMDQFMVYSARESLAHNRFSRSLIYNRAIFIFSSWGFLFSSILVALFLSVIVEAKGPSKPALNQNQGAAPAVAEMSLPPVQGSASVTGTSGSAAPAANRENGAPQTNGPKDNAESTMVSLLGDIKVPAITVWAMAVLTMFILAAALVAWVVARLIHRYTLPEIAHEDDAMWGRAARAFLGGIAIAVVAAVAVLIYPNSWLVLLGLYFGLTVWVVLPIVLANLIFVRYANVYTSNVLSAVQRKMDASQWTRYSTLRIDQRIAEVFNSIYKAWYSEHRRGRFDQPSSGGTG